MFSHCLSMLRSQGTARASLTKSARTASARSPASVLQGSAARPAPARRTRHRTQGNAARTTRPGWTLGMDTRALSSQQRHYIGLAPISNHTALKAQMQRASPQRTPALSRARAAAPSRSTTAVSCHINQTATLHVHVHVPFRGIITLTHSSYMYALVFAHRGQSMPEWWSLHGRHRSSDLRLSGSTGLRRRRRRLRR